VPNEPSRRCRSRVSAFAWRSHTPSVSAHSKESDHLRAPLPPPHLSALLPIIPCCILTAPSDQSYLRTATSPDQGEALVVLPKAPVLLRLPERPWGPQAVLPSSLVSSIAGKPLCIREARHVRAAWRRKRLNEPNSTLCATGKIRRRTGSCLRNAASRQWTICLSPIEHTTGSAECHP